MEDERVREKIRYSKLGEIPTILIEDYLIEWRKRLEEKANRNIMLII